MCCTFAYLSKYLCFVLLFVRAEIGCPELADNRKRGWKAIDAVVEIKGTDFLCGQCITSIIPILWISSILQIIGTLSG